MLRTPVMKYRPFCEAAISRGARESLQNVALKRRVEEEKPSLSGRSRSSGCAMATRRC
jgi:hypothetical protein